MLEGTSTGNLIAYVTGIVGALVIIAQAFPKVSGPIGRTIRSWSDNRRRAQRSSTAADIEELRRQVEGLESSLATMRTKARTHSEWDRKVYRELIHQGVDIGFPPDLF